MDLLIDIALYGIGAAVLIIAILALIGVVTGLTTFVQAYIDERRLHRSGPRSELETRHLAFVSSGRVGPASSLATNGAGRMTPGVAVENVIYPSRTFDRDSERLIDRGVPFAVTVRAGSRKRAVVQRELPSMVHFHPSRPGLLRGLADKFRTMGLRTCVANAAHNHEYTVSYAVEADITIRFEPKGTVEPWRAH